MKKILSLFIILLCFLAKAKADHITGGEIFYTYSPGSNGNINYSVTFKLFMRCHSNRRFNDPTFISIFDKGTNLRVSDINVSLSSQETISINDPDPCISNPPEVCFVVGYYNFTVSLPPSPHGYIMASQVNYRIAGINNLQSGYSNIGALYTAEIPGTTQVSTGAENSSAEFQGSDLVVVCANNRFSYSFGAADRDRDELRYSFCEAYRSGGGGNMVSATSPPPFESVPYGNGYDGSKPLGINVQIDPATGLLTGTAPGAGVYVVTVCVDEIRNGIVIARQRKDLQINVSPCNIAAAQLPPDYMLCKDSKTIYLNNLSTSPLIRTHFWQLINRNGAIIFTSTSASAVYTFADTGTYSVKLVINRGEACTDSTTSVVRVYPGFVPGYTFAGICFNKPTIFKDISTTVYGKVDSWNWSFGVTEQSPAFTFPDMGLKNVQLIVTNTVGCRDTVTNPVTIVDRPPINLAFKDTLICIGDPLTLHAAGNGNLSWTPASNINATSANPTVLPSVTTTYTVKLDDNGCINTDSVLVRVTDHVNLEVMADTTICQGDTIKLRIVSDAFKYSWTPSNQLINATVASPLAITQNSATTYTVTANIGSCVASGDVKVSTVPYPSAYAGRDTTICFNTSARLSGVTNGSSVEWSPGVGLSDPAILNPLITASKTTTYILSAYDTKGCPKPAKDSMTLTVLPQISAFAGTDTSVVANQPLQLAASGGLNYLWSPDYGLSSTHISNPVATYYEPFNPIRYRVLVYNEAGCVDSAFMTVKVFNTGPAVFVPTAFSPNGDGKNDLLRPIAAGIKLIQFFNVYNRWGQLVFTTNINQRGWDGTINGKAQPTGVFVWMVKAIDYNDTPYFQKGTVTLIK